MCGIAGMYNFKRGDLYRNYFQACIKTMKHRGPDDDDIWDNEENYITAFVRLSIRDLSINGRQPMFSADRNFCISFNGEIYNTNELKNLLKPYHISYHSSSDTETLLYSIIHLGIEKTLSVADGIFAFAWYDLKKNSLILARDRVGIKPLYAGISENGVVYSSQYDHIINHPYFKGNTLSASAVGNYLKFGYVPEDMGAIANTKLLLHGYYYVVEDNKVKEFPYYKYGTHTKTRDKKDLAETLSNAVQSQLVADVPVGTFMSGGVDSTLVTYYANKKQPVQSFTIGVKDSRLDESNAAKEFASIFGTKHSSESIDSGTFKNLIKDHIKAFSEPFADYSSLPTLMLSAFTRKKVTVALSGDGGDELFWGYPRNIRALALIPFYQKRLLRRRLSLVTSKVKQPSRIDIRRHWRMKNFIDYYYSSLAITGSVQWFSRLFNGITKHSHFYDEVQKKSGENSSANELMNIVRRLEVDIHLQRILLKVDRASMFHSLEVRVPFLSNDMLDLSEQYQFTDCIEGNSGKANLKHLLASYTSKELVYKPKQGFTVPLDEWLRKDLKDDVAEKLMDMPSHLSVMFKKGSLQALYTDYLNGSEDTAWLIWAIYALVLWDAEHRNKIK